MQRPWRAVWAAICRSLVDELPPEALGPLRVAFKKGGATTIAALFSDLDGQEAFTGPKAEHNLDTLLHVLQKWEDNPAMLQLRKELSTFYPALVPLSVPPGSGRHALGGSSISLASLFDVDPAMKNHHNVSRPMGEESLYDFIANEFKAVERNVFELSKLCHLGNMSSPKDIMKQLVELNILNRSALTLFGSLEQLVHLERARPLSMRFRESKERASQFSAMAAQLLLILEEAQSNLSEDDRATARQTSSTSIGATTLMLSRRDYPTLDSAVEKVQKWIESIPSLGVYHRRTLCDQVMGKMKGLFEQPTVEALDVTVHLAEPPSLVVSVALFEGQSSREDRAFMEERNQKKRSSEWESICNFMEKELALCPELKNVFDASGRTLLFDAKDVKSAIRKLLDELRRKGQLATLLVTLKVSGIDPQVISAIESSLASRTFFAYDFLPLPKRKVWITFNFESADDFRRVQATVIEAISSLLHVPSSSVEVGAVISVNPVRVEFTVAAVVAEMLLHWVYNGRVPHAVRGGTETTPLSLQVGSPSAGNAGKLVPNELPPAHKLDYSDPAIVELNELFHTKETVTQVYVESLIAAKHLFGPQSLTSYLERKLSNSSLPEFDLAAEVKRERGSNAIVVIAGILPGDIDAFGTANRWERLPWEHGAGEWSPQSGANSWRPSWFKFFSRRDRIMYFVLAVWPGEDVVAHYALTVCCKYPSLAESIRVWQYPVAEEQAFVRTKLEESTRAYVDGAVVVLGESDEIGKWLSQHFGLTASTFTSPWYRLNAYTNRHGRRIVLLQVMHPYWGSVAGALASRLFSYGCVELVHCGNVGRLMPTVETSLTIVSAPHRARHVASLESIKIDNLMLDWLRDNPPSVSLFPDHVHISIASPVLETKEMIEQWAACATIDVELFSLARAAKAAKRPFSCLHYVSDVVGSTHSLGDKWEDSLKSGAPQAKHAMIVSVSTYLSQVGKK